MCVVITLGRRLATRSIIESGEILLPQCPSYLNRTYIPSKNADLFDRFIKCFVLFVWLHNCPPTWISHSFTRTDGKQVIYKLWPKLASKFSDYS